MPTVAFTVLGRPVPQGSLQAHVRKGKATVHYQSGSELGVWRSQVATAAHSAWGDTVYGGTFSIGMLFTMRRPRSHYADLQGSIKPQYVQALPNVKPDLDKLVRAILDALTGIVWHDDGQVCMLLAWKEYGEQTGVQVTLGYGETSEHTRLAQDSLSHRSEGQGNMLDLR
jgi:crossover junction endodeoxyribonuclease RusA